MCYGHVDHSIAMREAEDRIRAAQSVAETDTAPTPRPIWGEVLVRLGRLFGRGQPAD